MGFLGLDSGLSQIWIRSGSSDSDWISFSPDSYRDGSGSSVFQQLDLVVFWTLDWFFSRIVFRCLTIQRCSTDNTYHNLFDDRAVFFDFWEKWGDKLSDNVQAFEDLCAVSLTDGEF